MIVCWIGPSGLGIISDRHSVLVFLSDISVLQYIKSESFCGAVRVRKMIADLLMDYGPGHWTLTLRNPWRPNTQKQAT